MEFKQMTLSQCAQFDNTNKLRDKVTGWGAISKIRCIQKVSRKVRIGTGKGKRGGKS